jgi:hypothetical protein
LYSYMSTHLAFPSCHWSHQQLFIQYTSIYLQSSQRNSIDIHGHIIRPSLLPRIPLTESILSDLAGVWVSIFYPSCSFSYMRPIWKVTSICFRQLMWEQGRAHAREVASHDSLPCKPSYNWSPNVLVSTE